MSGQHNQRNNNLRDRPRQRRREDSPTVALSKQLSWLLRHGLEQSGLQVRTDGYVSLTELLSHPRFRKYSITEIRDVVASNDKQRFTITSLDTPQGPQEFIRANQGHSIKTIQLEMQPIVSAKEYPTVIHGTNDEAWKLIAKDPNGLSRMSRNHIHFATGLLGDDGVISGMRGSCSVLIYVDLEKALHDGIKFFKSENGVVLTEGVKEEGRLPKDYFRKVVTTTGETLWPEDLDD